MNYLDNWFQSKDDLINSMRPSTADIEANKLEDDSYTCRKCSGPTHMRDPKICVKCQVRELRPK